MMVRQRTAAWVCAVVSAIGVSTALTAAQARAANEGIKVHGRWAIDIRNRNGTLASHLEFENSLTSDGAAALVQVLGRQRSIGKWDVGFWSITGQGPCLSDSAGICEIAEPDSADSGAQSLNLVVSMPTSGANAGALVLSGSVAVETDSLIRQVYTQLGLCAAGTTSAACTAVRSTDFTSFDLPSAQAVSAGQIVQVTVALSFS